MRAEATVVRLSRQEQRLTQAGSDLLSRFVEGSVIGIVHDPSDPLLVAIDRDRTPLEIAPTDAR